MPSNEDDPRLTVLRRELEASLQRNCYLEKENEQLKQEVAHLKVKICSLKAQNLERKSSVGQKLTTSIDSKHVNTTQQKPPIDQGVPKESQVADNACSKEDSPEITCRVEHSQRVLNPPPRPAAAAATTVLPGKVIEMKVPSAPAPPPPPPLPSKSRAWSSKVVRRVPEVMQFYRSLTRRDTRIDNRTNFQGIPVDANTRNMIGEIENRSTHLLAIKSDVETQGEFIRYLTREVENASYSDMSEVEAFVKWLDGELSYLVDERAVLKHFPQWPEYKADAMREAAFTYRDLKTLESEASSFRDNPKQNVHLSLKRMQALQDRLERGVHNTERMRDSVSKKYREFQIPCEWMLDTGVISQLKLSSVRLAREYMKRVVNELQTNECSQNLMLQGVRFAYRVHQFAGGFDAEAMHAFEELRKLGMDNHGQ